MKLTMRTLVPMALVMGVMGAIDMPTLVLPDLNSQAPDTIRFLPVEGWKCATGAQFYFGVTKPKEVTEPNKFWLEQMGGAICFNKQSCVDDQNLAQWLDLRTIVTNYGGGNVFDTIIDGYEIPNDIFAGLGAGYMPGFAGKPLDGQYGIYLPSCNGDTGLGNWDVTYAAGNITHHTGAAGFSVLLDAIKVALSNITGYTGLTQFSMLGGSGSAVSRVAWAPAVADMFPTARVVVLADSAMHVLPGTSVFQYFYDKMQWSPNPDGYHANATVFANDVIVPEFDWQKADAIPRMLRKYDGRIKVGYIHCERDGSAHQHRVQLANHAPDFTEETDVFAEGWTFLKNLYVEAPIGTAYSYVGPGTCHHETRGVISRLDIPNATQTATEFVTDFLQDKEQPQHQWCCGKEFPDTKSPTPAPTALPTVAFSAGNFNTASWISVATSFAGLLLTMAVAV